MSKEELSLLIYVAAVFLGFVIFTVVFVVAFQRRKNKFLLERIEAQQRFEREIETSKLEIQEQTLRNIAWELHDNIGQLLSVVNMQLNIMMQQAPKEFGDQLIDTKSTVSQTVAEVRMLSKTLNHDVIQKNGLITSLQVESERFNRLQFLKSDLEVLGNEIDLPSDHEIIIFRILQEFFSNVIKHAKANNLFVLLDYQSDKLIINVADDGIGFDTNTCHGNSGMETMKSRASLIGAKYEISSEVGKGTKLQIEYNLNYDKNRQS